jgi:CRISPR/Cas system-associated protein endoribonuclease Cas2
MVTTQSGYQVGWLFVAYNFPHDTSAAKAAARRFLRRMRHAGYRPWVRRGKVLFRHCGRYGQLQMNLISRLLPPDGEVMAVVITDKQFARMVTLWGKMRVPATPM